MKIYHFRDPLVGIKLLQIRNQICTCQFAFGLFLRSAMERQRGCSRKCPRGFAFCLSLLIFLCGAFFFFFPPSFFQKLCVVHTIHITITIDSWGCSWLKYYWEDNYKLWVVVNVPDSALLKTSHTAQSCTLWACSHEWILHKEHLLPFP